MSEPSPVRIDDDATLAPDLPPGYAVSLPGRGTTFLRVAEGPEGAPTVLLLHGWLASGGLNWYRCFEPLSRHFRVIAPDLRGHGRGIRSSRRFRLHDCADDVADLLGQLGADPVIAVGYSMGGPVAQLLWRHHRSRVAGLVLTATGAEFMPGNRERYAFSVLMAAAAGTSRLGALATVGPRFLIRRLQGVDLPTGGATADAAWARREMSGHSLRMLAEAGLALSTYSARNWVSEIDVPASVVVTEQDSAVSPAAQMRLALAIPGAHVNRIPGGHVACTHPEFGRKITDACRDIQRRIDSGWQPTRPLEPS